MKGIQVLNKISINQPTKESLIFVICVYIIFTIIFTIYVATAKELSHVNKKQKWVASFICSAIVSILLTMMVSCIIVNIWTEPSGKYEYQVTIDKSVNMKEFDSKYVILKQDGKIYTIKKKR